MTIPRRDLLARSAVLAVMSGIIVAAGAAGLRLVTAGWPQIIPMAELMAPGTLPDQAIGAAESPVTIVEYASMTCTHCATFHEKTYPELKKRSAAPQAP